MKNNKLITKSGSYWKYGSSFVDKDIIIRNMDDIVPIGVSNRNYWSKRDCINGWTQGTKTTGQYAADVALQNCSVAANGIYYGNDCRSSYKFRKSPSAWSYCSSKGMRLPTRSEAVGIIPSCGTWTWTSDNGDYYDSWTWHGSSTYFQGSSNGRHSVRCVK